MKPRTEEEFYAYMRGDPEFAMTPQEASDFYAGVDAAIKRDKLLAFKGQHATGRTYQNVRVESICHEGVNWNEQIEK